MNVNLKSWLLACMLTAPCMAQVGLAQQAGNGDGAKAPVQKTRSETFVLAQNKEWEPADPDVVRQVMGYDGQVMLVKVKFLKAGAVGTPHAHYHTQTTYVESGKFEFTINGEKKIVSAGDGLYVEPDAVHGCVCLEPGMLIDCFAPMRETFLKK